MTVMPAGPTTQRLATVIRLPGSAPSPVDRVAALQQDLEEMFGMLEDAEQHNQALTDQARHLQRQLGRAEAQIAHLHAQHGHCPSPVFADPVEQFEHEVYLAWAARTSPADKIAHPRRPWRVGPSFLHTLDTLQGVSRSKVVDVVVDLITGRLEGVRPLKSGPHPKSPVVKAANGSVVWRVNLQHNTSAARRLHYTQDRHGIELTSVRVHDDCTA